MILEQFYADMQNDPKRYIVETDEKLSAMISDMIGVEGMTLLEYQNALDAAEAKNNAISSTKVYETNEKIINNLYITYMRNGFTNFTEQEALLIENLAMQCPYVGGSGVYKARNLYALYNPMQAYEDIEICNAVGVFKNSKGLFDDENEMLDSMSNNSLTTITNQNKLTLYPNPATTEITVEYNATENTLLTIYDITGRAVLQTELSSKNNNLKIDISRLANSVYTFKQSFGTRLDP